ncbi:MAG: cupin domain-containing protein [Planctomycetota bacterium]|nr:cupin domain-containing protein [Planctomycetota bacterium]
MEVHLQTGLDLAVTSVGVTWRETSSPGVSWCLLATEAGAAGGAAAGGTVLIRMDPGCGYPAHRHLGVEEVLVLAGGYRDAEGEYRAGDYLRYPPGSVHAPVAIGDVPCLLFATARDGIEVLPGGGASG